MFRVILAIYSMFQRARLFAAAPFAPRRARAGRDPSDAALPAGTGVALRKIPAAQSGTAIWVHAAGGEEVAAVRPVLDALSAECDDLRLFLSTTAVAGRAAAGVHFGNRATVFPLPADLPLPCRRFLRHIRPRVLLLTGEDLPFNLIVAAETLRVPVLVVHGHVSDRSFRRRERFPCLVRPCLARIAHFCMRSREDRDRILRLGAPRDRVNWVGDVRFDFPDGAPEPSDSSPAKQFERALRRNVDDLLLSCPGFDPGAAAGLVGIYRRLRGRFPGLKLLLAPQQAGREAEILSLLEREGISGAGFPQRGTGPDPSAPIDAIVTDFSRFHLAIHEAADLVFMGGILVPVEGKQPIAAAAMGKPILLGSDAVKSWDVGRVLIENYAALEVGSPEELEARLIDLIADPHARRWLGRNARRFVRANQGSLSRTAEIVRRYLKA